MHHQAALTSMLTSMRREPVTEQEKVYKGHEALQWDMIDTERVREEHGSALHAGGQGFESPSLHHFPKPNTRILHRPKNQYVAKNVA